MELHRGIYSDSRKTIVISVLSFCHFSIKQDAPEISGGFLPTTGTRGLASVHVSCPLLFFALIESHRPPKGRQGGGEGGKSPSCPAPRLSPVCYYPEGVDQGEPSE